MNCHLRNASASCVGVSTVGRKDQLIGRLAELLDEEDEVINDTRVFLAHGRSSLWAQVARFIERELDIEPVVLEESRLRCDVVRLQPEPARPEPPGTIL